MAALRDEYRKGEIGRLEYRVRSARLIDQIQQATTSRPKYAIS